MKVYDVAVIGGGIVGLASAMALAQRGSKVIVLEAESKLAAHQTGNNSGVIHSGLYYRPGSLKAKNCSEGREKMYRFCQENGIANERCGKLVVVTSPEEIPALEELEKRGTANGLRDLRRLTLGELRDHEPHVNGIAGLLVKETGIVDFIQVCAKFAEKVKNCDGEILTEEKFTSFSRDSDHLVLETGKGEVHAKYLINCGGLQSDRVARMCGVEPGLKIVPFRGEYYEIVPAKYHLVKNLIYPVPDARFPFLGVHFTRMIHGGVEAGPNAVFAFKREGYKKSDISFKDLIETFTYGGFWHMAIKYWKMGMGEFYRSYSKKAFVRALQKLIPEITGADVHPGGAGVRAQAVEPNGFLVDDFRIVEAERMIHVLNAPSPAATASISIGESIADTAEKSFALK